MQDSFNELIQKIHQLKSLMPFSAEAETKLWRKLKLDWNYYSNHIEGNTLTYGETVNLLERGIACEKPYRDNLEIKAHDLAVEEMRLWFKKPPQLEDAKPISHNYIRDLNKTILKEPYYKKSINASHEILSKEIIPGAYKTQSNSVILQDGSLFHYASPEKVHPLMSDLINEINLFLIEKKSISINASEDLHDILVKLASFHHRFTLIHPFDDGNGRVSRLLSNFILMFLDFPPIVIKDKDKYLNALNYADNKDLDKLVDLFSAALLDSVNLSIKAARGLDLDEDDDLDKELSILKRNLNIKENSEALTRDERIELFKKHYSENLYKLAEQFVIYLSKFDELFHENIFYCFADTVHYRVDNASLEEKTAITKSEKVLILLNSKDTKYYELWFIYDFNQLKDGSLSESTFRVDLKIRFGLDSYSINSSIWHKQMSEDWSKQDISTYKKHGEYLLDLEIHDISKQISKKLLEMIVKFKKT